MKIFLPILFFISLLSSCSMAPGSTPVVQNPPTEDRTIATPTYGTGKTQIIVFADFQCPACIATNESLFPILEGYAASGRLTITYRQFPLSMHKNAKGDAIAALCSAEWDKYMDYKKWLYALEKMKSGKTITDEERVALAKSVGLDEAKFSDCLAKRAYEKQVDADIALGDSMWVTGTPTIYLDGIKLDMSLFQGIDGFRSFLESRMK